jgi:hypothetical protein
MFLQQWQRQWQWSHEIKSWNWKSWEQEIFWFSRIKKRKRVIGRWQQRHFYWQGRARWPWHQCWWSDAQPSQLARHSRAGPAPCPTLIGPSKGKLDTCTYRSGWLDGPMRLGWLMPMQGGLGGAGQWIWCRAILKVGCKEVERVGAAKDKELD